MNSFHVFGEEPRPRVLVQGFEPEVADQIGELVPTSKLVEALDSVHQPEWDMLVTATSVPLSLAPHIYVVAFGGSFGSHDGAERNPVAYRGRSRAREFEIPQDLPPHIASLVLKDLLPQARASEVNSVLRRIASVISGEMTCSITEVTTPFLRTREPEILAGRFLRAGRQAETWAIGATSDPVAWVRAALIEWHKRDPDRFPVDLSWRGSTEWLSSEELAVLEEITQLQSERHAVLADLDRRQAALKARMKAAHDRADAGPRRLITAKGTELVGAVAQSLRALGFLVEERDDQHRARDHLEDLLVRDPEHEGWEAIVEVRGYKKGAQVKDLLRIARFILRRVRDGHPEPDRRWYIVNQFAGQDPTCRQRPIPNDSDVATFAEDGGLIIDTIELYRLQRQLDLGQTTAEAARSLLKTQTGRFRLTSQFP